MQKHSETGINTDTDTAPSLFSVPLLILGRSVLICTGLCDVTSLSVPQAGPGRRISRAFPTRTSCRTVGPAISLRARYAESGTDTAYGGVWY
eukprot:934112-Rhodomonas_salina.2